MFTKLWCVSAADGRGEGRRQACRATTTFVFQSLQGSEEVLTFPHSPSSAQFLENVGVVSNTLRNAIIIIMSPITNLAYILQHSIEKITRWKKLFVMYTCTS
jgi:inosine-uridine nucleoside N-ribohydrolase